jgi:hypothetical protein
MQVAEPTITSPLPPFSQAGALPKDPAERSAVELNLSEMPVDELREQIRKNRVTFPAQVPVFSKHDRSDVQRQLVQLYFLFGWSGPRIGIRFGLRRIGRAYITSIEQLTRCGQNIAYNREIGFVLRM